MGARVFDAIETGGSLVAGRVVNRIYLERLPANARAQGVDECLAGRANTRRLTGTAGERHLNIGARLGGRGWKSRSGKDGSAKARRYDGCGTKETTDVQCDHAAHFANSSTSHTMIFDECSITVALEHTFTQEPAARHYVR